MKTYLIPAVVIAGMLFASTAEARPRPLRWLASKVCGAASKVRPFASCSNASTSRGSNCSAGACSKPAGSKVFRGGCANGQCAR